MCLNPHLVEDLISLNLWTHDIKNRLIADGGSIQNIHEIPENFRNLYKTVWEVPQKALIDMAVARSPFIDQSQSLNVYIAEPSFGKLTSLHFYCWKKGLKTGMYYLRTRPAADAIKFTVDVEKLLISSGFNANAPADLIYDENLYPEMVSERKKSEDEPCVSCSG